MTEKEQKLIEDLTKQLEINNKIALKQIQESKNPSVNEERLTEAEIGLINEKERFFKNGANLLSALNTLTIIIAAFICIAALISISACASNF